MKNEELISSFNQNKDFYDESMIAIEKLLLSIFEPEKKKIHKLECRVKKEDSLIKKIENKDKYEALDNITDIIGFRIITLFEDDIDSISKVISKEFEIDIKNSIDKRKSDSNEFGYQSLQYIVSLSKQRKKLPEYIKFKDIKFEIQIRSVLQHARAEIEHDLGYKNESSVPQQDKRAFLRLSALLETADIEFIRLKKSLNKYEKSLPKKIKEKPGKVLIDKLSISSALNESKIIRDIDLQIGKNSNSNIIFLEESIAGYIKQLKYFGINDIYQLEKLLKDNKDIIIRWANDWIGIYNDNLAKGISIFYLGKVLATQKMDNDKILDYLIQNNIGKQPDIEVQEMIDKFSTLSKQ